MHEDMSGEIEDARHARRLDHRWARLALAMLVAATAMAAASAAMGAVPEALRMPASGAAGATTLPSLVGRWLITSQYNTVTQEAMDFSLQPGGKIVGYIEPAPDAAQCLRESGGPNNQAIVYGNGPTYTGVGAWSSSCASIGYGPLVFEVDTDVTPNTWTSCSNQPGGPPPVFGSCQASANAVRASSQPFPGSTGIVFPTRLPTTLAVGSGSSSGSLDVPVQCGSSYYQGTTPCDATYYVWHCGSSYSTAFTPCPPNTPGALPPVKSSSLARRGAVVAAQSSSRRAVGVGGGTVTVGPKQKATLKFGLTAQAKSGFAGVRRQLMALATQAKRASATGHSSTAKRLRAELARRSKVTLLVRVTNDTNGVSKISRLTVHLSS